MSSRPRCALAITLAVCLAAPAASARPGHKAKHKHTRVARSARSATPTPRSDRPKQLVRGGDSSDLTPRERMAEQIRKVWSGRTLRRGTTAVYVVDARTGEVLYAVNEDAPLNPASNVKLISTATVLDTLGPDWRYTTRLFGPTPGPDGIAHGDVYLLGSFDPTLTTDDVRELAARLAESGVHKISGDLLLGPDSRRDGVGLSRVRIHVTATNPGEPPVVSVTPPLSFVDLDVTATTTKRRRARLHVHTERVEPPDDDSKLGPTPAWVDGDASEEVDAIAAADPAAPVAGARPASLGLPAFQDRLVITISGKIRKGRTRSYRRWVPQRVQLAAEVLRAALLDAGIEIEGGIRRVDFESYVEAAQHAPMPYLPVELARHESARIGALVRRVNKRSINWLADALVKTAGAVTYGGVPNLGKGVHAMKSWLGRVAGIDPTQVTLDTGSGLSYKTMLTVKHIVRVLRTAAGFTNGEEARKEPPLLADVFRHSLSVAGRDGTLRRRFRKSHVRGNLIGKTGTLTGIIALSGVLSTDDGDALCFSIVTNHHRRGYRHRVRREHEAMVKAMYDYLEERTQTKTASR